MDELPIPDGPELKQFRTVYTNPDNVQPTLVDAFHVQHTPDIFYLTAARVNIPIVSDPTEYDSMESLDATIVAKFALTPSQMFRLVVVLQENLARYQQRFDEAEGEP